MRVCSVVKLFPHGYEYPTSVQMAAVWRAGGIASDMLLDPAQLGGDARQWRPTIGRRSARALHQLAPPRPPPGHAPEPRRHRASALKRDASETARADAAAGRGEPHGELQSELQHQADPSLAALFADLCVRFDATSQRIVAFHSTHAKQQHEYSATERVMERQQRLLAARTAEAQDAAQAQDAARAAAQAELDALTQAGADVYRRLSEARADASLAESSRLQRRQVLAYEQSTVAELQERLAAEQAAAQTAQMQLAALRAELDGRRAEADATASALAAVDAQLAEAGAAEEAVMGQVDATARELAALAADLELVRGDMRRLLIFDSTAEGAGKRKISEGRGAGGAGGVGVHARWQAGLEKLNKVRARLAGTYAVAAAPLGARAADESVAEPGSPPRTAVRFLPATGPPKRPPDGGRRGAALGRRFSVAVTSPTAAARGGSARVLGKQEEA